MIFSSERVCSVCMRIVPYYHNVEVNVLIDKRAVFIPKLYVASWSVVDKISCAFYVDVICCDRAGRESLL